MNYALSFCQAMLLGGAAALATACNPFAQTEDCYRGLSTGQMVEVELLEPQSHTGRYLYWDRGVTSVPCANEDGLGPGSRVRFRLALPGAGGGGCWTYRADLLAPLPGVSPQTQGRGGSGAVLGSQNRYESATCPATYWRFFALRHPSLDDDPLHDPGDPGLYPPVVVMREINGCCIDQWSATIRAVEPLDAGTDAP